MAVPHAQYAFTYKGWSILDPYRNEAASGSAFIRAAPVPPGHPLTHESAHRKAASQMNTSSSLSQLITLRSGPFSSPSTPQSQNTSTYLYIVVGYTTATAITSTAEADGKFTNACADTTGSGFRKNPSGSITPPIHVLLNKPKVLHDLHNVHLLVVAQYDPRQHRFYVLLSSDNEIPGHAKPYTIKKGVVYFRAAFRTTQSSFKKRRDTWYTSIGNTIQRMRGVSKPDGITTSSKKRGIEVSDDEESQNTASDSDSDSWFKYERGTNKSKVTGSAVKRARVSSISQPSTTYNPAFRTSSITITVPDPDTIDISQASKRRHARLTAQFNEPPEKNLMSS